MCTLIKHIILLAQSSPDEHAYMLSTAESLAKYDTRLFICKPYNGDPADFERFITDLKIRLLRAHLPHARAAIEWSLTSTMKGDDDYGDISQADLDLYIGSTDNKDATAAARKERKLMWADHYKRNSLVYSHVLSLITDVNLKDMIKETPNMKFGGGLGSIKSSNGKNSGGLGGGGLGGGLGGLGRLSGGLGGGDDGTLMDIDVPGGFWAEK